jgi:hypothetical protein
LSAKLNIGVKIENDMKTKIEYIAKFEGVSYADWIRFTLFEAIKKFEKENGKITAENLNQLKLFAEKEK